MIITEYELRANWHKTKDEIITIPQGTVITPAARDFLRQKGIKVQVEGNGILDLTQVNYSTSRQSMAEHDFSKTTRTKHTFHQEPIYYPASRNQAGKETMVPSAQAPRGASSSRQVSSLSPMRVSGSGLNNSNTAKPEHMTHLYNVSLVAKTHPVIALRGQLDLFAGELAEVQILSDREHNYQLLKQLEEVAQYAREIMVAEVKQQPFQMQKLLGFSTEEIHEMSHHPSKYFGVKHAPLNHQNGILVIKLHQLRARIREVELAAARAFIDTSGNCIRPDIILALNRLSSALYIMACQQTGAVPADRKVPIGISNRHIHLSQADLNQLFGSGYELTVMKALRQPGQYAAQETVSLEGPKGILTNVRILGPVRNKTQVELSVTDCFNLGIRSTVRDSGNLEGTDGITVIGPAGRVTLPDGVIVARRHLHLNPEQAKMYGLSDGQKVNIRVDAERPLEYKEILVRVGPTHEMEFHLDTDEANSALIGAQSYGVITGVCR